MRISKVFSYVTVVLFCGMSVFALLQSDINRFYSFTTIFWIVFVWNRVEYLYDNLFENIQPLIYDLIEKRNLYTVDNMFDFLDDVGNKMINATQEGEE